MNPNIVTFEVEKGIKTSDNFHVTLKGFVEGSSELDNHDELEKNIKKSCQEYINTIPLLEALDLVNEDKSKVILEQIEGLPDSVHRLKFNTVDAVEGGDFSEVDVEIDPSLESQKKSKGLLGKIKGFFKK